jgi:hypothetical protein
MNASLPQRLAHRAEWLTGLYELTVGLASPPVIDPTLDALRGALAPVPTPIDPSTTPIATPALADAARRHELEVFIAHRVPGLAKILKSEISDRRRAAAILELAQAELAQTLSNFLTTWLKGAATWTLYPEGACRTRRDLDLLVGDQVANVRLHLLARGWQDATTPRRTELGPDRVRAWPMTRSYGPFGVSLDLHRELQSNPWCALSAAPILAASNNGQPTPEDSFLITLNHLVESGFHEPLKGWLDLAYLARIAAPDRLLARARATRMTRALWLADHVLTRWFRGHRPLAVPAPPRLEQKLLTHLAAGDHDTPERRPLYKGLSQRLWRTLLSER